MDGVVDVLEIRPAIQRDSCLLADRANRSPMKFSVDKYSILHLRWTRSLHRLIRHGWPGNSSAGKGMQGLVSG